MKPRALPANLPERCWTVIGIGGDRSCGELAEYTHCRNCPVFTAAGRELMEQQAPPGYLAEWTEFLAGARLRTTTRSISTLVFRIASEWLAIDAATIGEIATMRSAHRIAHRTSGVLVGLVNIRGQLLLQVSLQKLLHLEAAATSVQQPRLVVIQQKAASWVFQVDEVLGVQRFSTNDISPVPVTVAQGMARVSRGLISLGARNVGYVDTEQLFTLLRQAVGVMADAMLLGLFRDEIATHLLAIEAGFDALDTAEAHQLEAIARAAHSIKGAARIVDVTPAVRVASTLESLFDATKIGAARVTSADLGMLQRAVAILRSIAALTDDELSAGAAAIKVDDVVTSIAALEKRPAVASPAPAPVHSYSASTSQSLARLDAALIDLFKVEAETHGSALQSGLLALEQDPSRVEALQSLMRAAHSIKGAARVVNVDVAVALAHVMEDCFVAAQNGRVTLGAHDIDLLLQGTDTLLAASANIATLDAWTAANGQRVATLVQGIERIVHAATHAARETAAPVAIVEPTAAAPVATVERVVRVATTTIDLLMNLAGESLVETRRFEPLVKQMHKLVQRQAHVTDLLADARFSLADRERAERLLDTARTHAVAARRQTVEMMAELDAYARRAEDLTNRAYRAAISSRMRPFADGVHAFPRVVRDLARKLDKKVDLVITGETVGVDRDILEKLEAPLNHLLRNSIDHGLESAEERLAAGKRERGTLRLEARHWAGMLTVTVADDGRGIDPARVRRRIVERKLLGDAVAQGLTDAEALDYLFTPGFSTSDKVTEVSGRGVGLDVVRSVVEEVGGSVRLSSEIGKGTAFNLQLPITLSVIRAVVVEIAGEPYAFPMMRIERILHLQHNAIQTLEGQQYFAHEGKNIGLVPGHQVLDLPATPSNSSKLPVVILSDRAHVCGVAVDRFLGEHDLVIRPLDPRLGKIADISAAAVLTDGTPLLIIDVEDMVRSIVRMLQKGQLRGVERTQAATQAAHRKLRVLVVDDSITVREVQRQLLGNRGYEVAVAVDGMDGWHAVRDGEFDLVITDVDMPRMNGIDLVKSVKRDPRLKAIPMMIVSYRDREEDKQRGLDAGADYYFTKSDFHDDALLRAVSDLIGDPP